MLTQEQQNFIKAIETTSDNIALVARAGSGKTFSLVAGAKKFPKTDRGLAVAFNKSIADELSEVMPGNVKCMTFNALGHRALQRFLGDVQLRINMDKTGKIVKGMCKEDPRLWDYWIDICNLVGKAKLHGMVPNGAPGKAKPLLNDTDENWEALIAEYDFKVPTGSMLQQDIEEDKQFEWLDIYRNILLQAIEAAFAGEIDFDDQIYIPVCWNIPVSKWDFILVDEAQDLSDLQHRFIDRMMDDSCRIIMCGDPFQAIYAFRGALSDSMDKMIDRYECVELPLTTSFRCPKNVIAVAQQDVPDIYALSDAPDGQVIRMNNWDASSIEPNSVILCRNVAPLITATYRLIAGGRPAVMKGRDIGKGLVTLTRNIIKPKKVARKEDFLERLEAWKDNEIAIARSKGQAWREDSIHDKADSIAAVQSYSMAQDTDQLIVAIEKIFAVEVGDRVTLCTIHRSKGFEWDTVYFLDSFMVPSKYAQDAVKKDAKRGMEQMRQEYNLRYVAVTRAKDKLVYIDTKKFYDHDDDSEEVTQTKSLPKPVKKIAKAS